MTDYSIKEITIIDGGVNKISEFEAPGDYQVSVLIDYAPPVGALYRRVHAIVRDRRLAIFPSSFIPEHEKDTFPLLGTVYGVNAAIARGQVYGGPGGLPTKLRIEEMLNLPNLYAKAPVLKPPRLPLGQKIDPVEGKTKTKTQVDPDAPYAAYKEPSAREILESGSFAYETRDGQVHVVPAPEAPADPIVQFMEMLRPMIEEMAKLTAIPVQIVPEEPEWVKRLTGGVPVTRVDIKPPTPVTEVRNVTVGGQSPVDIEATVNRAHRRHRGDREPGAPLVTPVGGENLATSASHAGVYTRGPGESWVRIDMPVSEFRALLSENAFTVLADQAREPQRAVQFAQAIASHMLRFLRTQGVS